METVLLEIVSDRNDMSETTYELIKWAISKNKIHELIKKMKEDSDNQFIQEFYYELVR